MEKNSIEVAKETANEIYDWLKINQPNKLVSKKSIRIKFELTWIKSSYVFGYMATLPDCEVTDRTVLIKVPQ